MAFEKGRGKKGLGGGLDGEAVVGKGEWGEFVQVEEEGVYKRWDVQLRGGC